MAESAVSPAPRFSVVIPAYNEEAYLPRLVDSINAAREAYAGGRDAVEVVVGDNVSTDATAAVALARGCRVARVEKRVIGAVRNGAVQLSRGEILLFVDADVRIHPNTFNAIDAGLANGKVVTGALRLRIERISLGLALTYIVTTPLVWLIKTSTGPVFCRRADFDAIGGYDEDLLFQEDIKILNDLKALGRTRGQKFRRLTRARAIASTRKWDVFGEWHIFKIFFTGLYGLIFRSGNREARIKKFAEDYWYDAKGR
ncbi:MAG: glycosyltransferase [Candidatus Hydrogenedentes bacterium]|jgi:glycosyltransferase involved in cell wall biosynthesis|nr:glycosyltransferase [Candidatus Hydrogenedentota bacterium]